MSLGKKELRLVALLGVIVYAFVFYKFVWADAVPQIKEQQEALAKAREEKEYLDSELKKVPEYRQQIASKKTMDERLHEYLLENASIIDSYHYMERLYQLLGKEIREVIINSPKERKVDLKEKEKESAGKDKEENKFYELSIDIKTTLNYAEIQELAAYVEGASRKVSITKFEMTPAVQDQVDTARAAIQVPVAGGAQVSASPNPSTESPARDVTASEKVEFDVKMTANLYSLDNVAANRLYQFANDKFNTYSQETENYLGVPEKRQ